MTPRLRTIDRRTLLRGAALGAGGSALLLIACGGGDKEDGAGGTAGGTSATSGPAAGGAPGPTTINVRLWDNPGGFDPATLFRIETENVAFNVYNALSTWDATTSKILPDLAEKWETPDQTTYTFSLRKGVKWHKGYGELSARDVVYSYERVLDPATASPYRGDFANVESVSAPDASTVAIKLKAPDVHFLHQVASYHQGQIVKEEAVKQFGDQYQRNPIGTGPFIMESFTPNAEIVLVRNPEYFRGPATLEKVIYRIIRDPSAGEIALKNKEIDLGGTLTLNEILQRIKTDNRFALHKADGYANNLMILSPDFAPFQKQAVRHAIAHAIDFPAVIKATGPETAKEALSIVPQFMDVYSKDVPTYKYDVAKAKALLKEAGYEQGFGVKWLATSGTGVSDAMLLYQSYLEKVGVKVQFEMVETTVWNQRRNRGEFELTARLLPGINPDTILFSYLHPANAAPKGLNGAKYDNSRVTAALEAGRAEPDERRRLAQYAEAQKLAIGDLWYIPTQEATAVWPAWKNVQGIVINKLGNVDLYPVSLTKG